jgi:hypothetical protein
MVQNSRWRRLDEFVLDSSECKYPNKRRLGGPRVPVRKPYKALSALEIEALYKYERSFSYGKQSTDTYDLPYNDSFSCSEVMNWWNSIKNYEINKKITIFLPCARARISNKIIQDSITHKCFARAITRWNHPSVQNIIISEPLCIIPYERRDYPSYNYPPVLLRLPIENRIKDYHLFISRLESWLALQKESKLWFWFGSSGQYHHPRILQASWNKDLPCFAFIPRGGFRNIGTCAHFLHLLLSDFLAGKDVDMQVCLKQAPYLDIFMISKENRKNDVSIADFLQTKISITQLHSFFTDIDANAILKNG